MLIEVLLRLRSAVTILAITIILAGCGSETHSFACGQMVDWAEPRVSLINRNTTYEEFQQLDAGEVSSDAALVLALVCTEFQPEWDCVVGGTYTYLAALSSVVDDVKSGELDEDTFELTNGITLGLLNEKFNLLREGNDSAIAEYCSEEEAAVLENQKYTGEFCLNAYNRLSDVVSLLESRNYVIENETELRELREAVSSCASSYEEAKAELPLRRIIRTAISPFSDEEYQRYSQESIEELKMEITELISLKGSETK